MTFSLHFQASNWFAIEKTCFTVILSRAIGIGLWIRNTCFYEGTMILFQTLHCVLYSICIIVVYCQLKIKSLHFLNKAVGGDKLHQHIEAYWLEITIKSRRWAGQPILWDQNRQGRVRGWRGRRGHNNWIILLRWDSVTENLYYLAGINGLPFNGLRSLSHLSLLSC